MKLALYLTLVWSKEKQGYGLLNFYLGNRLQTWIVKTTREGKASSKRSQLFADAFLSAKVIAVRNHHAELGETDVGLMGALELASGRFLRAAPSSPTAGHYRRKPPAVYTSSSRGNDETPHLDSNHVGPGGAGTLRSASRMIVEITADF